MIVTVTPRVPPATPAPARLQLVPPAALSRRMPPGAPVVGQAVLRAGTPATLLSQMPRLTGTLAEMFATAAAARDRAYRTAAARTY